jgi:hypothetical protein
LCFTTRFRRIEPSFERLTFGQLEVRDHLVVQLALETCRSEQRR